MKRLKTYEDFNLELENKKWIQDIHMKKGALKKQLGYDEDETIPMNILNQIKKSNVGDTITIKDKEIKVTALLKKRATLAKTLKNAK